MKTYDFFHKLKKKKSATKYRLCKDKLMNTWNSICLNLPYLRPSQTLIMEVFCENSNNNKENSSH